jgi:hypothetical protein
VRYNVKNETKLVGQVAKARSVRSHMEETSNCQRNIIDVGKRHTARRKKAGHQMLMQLVWSSS